VNWKSLSREGWFFSPRLEAWQKKILSDLRRRAPSDKKTTWILSSGTSSVRSVKAIALSHESILLAADAANEHLKSGAKDRWMLAIPHYHIGGLSIFARAHLSGAKVFTFASKWNAAKFVRALAAESVTLTSLVPTQVHDLVAAGLRAPESLRAAVIGGGALQPSLYLAARALGWPVLPSYGLTECCSQVATASLASLSSAEYPAFKILPHAKVELREQRIFIKSASLCRWIAVGDSDGQFTLEDPRRDGWFATEDSAEWAGKDLRVLGRRDDVVKVLGVLVPLQEVERQVREEFLRHEWNENFIVAARDDARAGHRLILLTDSPNSLQDWQKQISSYNAKAQGPYRIQDFCWIPEISANEMGKIRKAALLRSLFS
jgi:o-succinylbenzoate---CoA ligase